MSDSLVGNRAMTEVGLSLIRNPYSGRNASLERNGEL